SDIDHRTSIIHHPSSIIHHPSSIIDSPRICRPFGTNIVGKIRGYRYSVPPGRLIAKFIGHRSSDIDHPTSISRAYVVPSGLISWEKFVATDIPSLRDGYLRNSSDIDHRSSDIDHRTSIIRHRS